MGVRPTSDSKQLDDVTQSESVEGHENFEEPRKKEHGYTDEHTPEKQGHLLGKSEKSKIAWQSL
jgi:hypothetical protein